MDGKLWRIINKNNFNIINKRIINKIGNKNGRNEIYVF